MTRPSHQRTGEEVDRFPQLGLGLGLRSVHFDHILKESPQVDWFEAISENFMDSHGHAGAVIRQVAERYPVVLHGVSMSIGSSDPLDVDYLTKLKRLADDVQAQWVSDHLCWTGILGLNSHDLLPLPLTEDVLDHVAQRVHVVQEQLQRPLVLENPSTYIEFSQSDISEPEFFTELCTRTDCRLLLDVNNVFVSSFNSARDPWDYLARFPYDRVVQMHLAGHQHCGTHIIDTHDGPVCSEVWELFRHAWEQCNGVATLLEWDGDIPDFDACHAELLKARKVIHSRPVQAAPSAPSMSDTAPGNNALSTPLGFIVPSNTGELA